MSQLSGVVLQLRGALDDVKSEMIRQQSSEVALEEFKVTVDRVRTNVLAMLTAEDSIDYHDFISRLRLRRAAQICQNVLSGFVDGTISAETPGYDELRSTVSTTLKRIEKMNSRTKQ